MRGFDDKFVVYGDAVRFCVYVNGTLVIGSSFISLWRPSQRFHDKMGGQKNAVLKKVNGVGGGGTHLNAASGNGGFERLYEVLTKCAIYRRGKYIFIA